MWVFFIGLKAQRQTGVLLLAGDRALAQGVWLKSQQGLIGSAWIGTEQVSNQLQAIVVSNRLAERNRTAADILDLPEVGAASPVWGMWIGLIRRSLGWEEMLDGQDNQKHRLSGWWHRCHDSVGNGLCHCNCFCDQQSLAAIQRLHR